MAAPPQTHDQQSNMATPPRRPQWWPSPLPLWSSQKICIPHSQQRDMETPPQTDNRQKDGQQSNMATPPQTDNRQKDSQQINMATPPRRPSWWPSPLPVCSAQTICIALVTLISMMFISLVATIIWLSFLPQKMKYSIERGSIDGYSFANYTLNANFHFQFRANNPNSGFSIYYNQVNVTVWYENKMLSNNGTVPPFHQPSHNVTLVGLDLVAKGVGINGSVAQDLIGASESGNIVLNLRLTAKITLRFGGFKIHRGLLVRCKGLKVPFSSSTGFEKVHCRKHVYD